MGENYIAITKEEYEELVREVCYARAEAEYKARIGKLEEELRIAKADSDAWYGRWKKAHEELEELKKENEAITCQG